MAVRINIVHKRQAVSEALKLCLFFSNYEEIEIFQTPVDLLRAFRKNDINLIDTEVIIPFLNEQTGDIPFSLLVTSESDAHIAEALYGGATSFINISKGPAQFVSQVELIAENKVDEPSYIIRNFLLERLALSNIVAPVDYHLTKKEMQILKMMRDGKHLKLIAYDTNTSYETIRTHVKHIYKKLGVVSASEAVIKAMKMSL